MYFRKSEEHPFHNVAVPEHSLKMDLNNLKDQVSNLTLYDLKAGVRKVQNGIQSCPFQTSQQADNNAIAVMNYTEMEAKVCHIHSWLQELYLADKQRAGP